MYFNNILKTVKLTVILLLFTGISSSACDICGCFMGITPYDNQSSLAILHRFRSFTGYDGQNHPFFPSGAGFFPQGKQGNSPISDHNDNPTDFEVYRATELRGRYFLSKKVELNAIIPYNSNSEQFNKNKNTVSGIGDVTIFSGYHLLRKLDQKKFNQRLIVGLGIKLPTGRSEAKNFEGIKYNLLSQTGTGSTDGFVYANYLIGYKKAGLSLSSTYKFNGRNKDQASIANSTTSFMNVFYNIGLNQTVKLVPSVQLAYEYSGGEKYKDVKTGEHVMNNLMSGVGMDIFIKNITLNMAVQTSAWAAKDDHPKPSGRVVLGLTYNFNQLYYLIN